MKHRISASIGLVLAVFLQLASGQPDSLWSRTYGGILDDVSLVMTSAADGYLLAGRSASFGPNGDNVWLVKTDNSGVQQWARAYGGNGGEQARAVMALADGSIVMAGRTSSFGSGGSNFWLIKTNAQGDSLWSRAYGGNSEEECNALLRLTDGGYLLAGTTHSFGAGGDDFWMLRTNANGDSLWSQSFGGAGQDQCWSVTHAEDGGFVLAGLSQSFGAGQWDVWLVKTSEQGDISWSRTLGGGNDDVCYSAGRAHDGGYVLGGYSESFGNAREFWLVKVDAEGDSLWSNTFGGVDDESCRQLIVLGDGGCLLSGYTRSFGSGGNDFWILRTDANGDSLWSRTFGRGSNELCYSALALGDNSFILGGQTNSLGAGGNDYWLVKSGPDPSVSARENVHASPSDYELDAYPNPFNSTTTIRFELPESQVIRLAVFDVRGRLVETLLDGRYSLGEHRVRFDADGMPSGTLFVRLSGSNITKTEKLVLIK